MNLYRFLYQYIYICETVFYSIQFALNVPQKMIIPDKT